MDKLPVEYDTTERLALGTDELIVCATSAQTNDGLFGAIPELEPARTG